MAIRTDGTKAGGIAWRPLLTGAAALLAALFLAIAPVTAQAYVCSAPIPLSQAVKNFQNVFIGQVTTLTYEDRLKEHPAGQSYPVGTVHIKYGLLATIKGDPSAIADLHYTLYGNPDDGVFKPGTAYLFLTYQDGHVLVPGCSTNTRPVVLEEVQEFAERLRQPARE